MFRLATVFCLLLCLTGVTADAQVLSSSATVTDPAFSGPVVIRDAEGAVTIRATRVTQPIALDGELNESIPRRTT